MAKVVWRGVMEKDKHTIFFDVQDEDVVIHETWDGAKMEPVRISIDDAIAKQENLERGGYEFTR